MVRLLRNLTYFVVALVESLLVFRFVLKLFGASAQASFVSWMYDTTQPLLKPFVLAFPTPSVQGQFVLEFTTLFAIFAYAFIGFLVQELLQVIVGKK